MKNNCIMSPMIMWMVIISSFIVSIAIISCSDDDDDPDPPLTFIKTFGGTSKDAGYSIQITNDGGYVIAGHTESYGAGGGDVYLIKTDNRGNELWSKTFGGTSRDVGYSIQLTNDGGYVIAGDTYSNGAGGGDVYLIKTDNMGHEIWMKTYGGFYTERVNSVHQASDGGYIIAGAVESYIEAYDLLLIKTDNMGNENWSKTFGITSHETDHGESVYQTSDGGFIITGFTESYGAGSADVYLIKTDNSGNEIWSRTFGGALWDAGFSVQQTSDGGYIIAGDTYSYGTGSGDVYLIKTDDMGHEIWSQFYGGTSSDLGYSVQQTSEGGYIIAGITMSDSGTYDVYLIKTDNMGTEIWSQIYGGTSWDMGYSVRQTSEGGYIVTGYTESYGAGEADVYLIKTDSAGNVL